MKVKVDELTEKAGRAVRENVAHIIFGAVVLLMVFLSFVDMGRGKGVFDWFGFAVNIALQLSLFIPYRWRQKRLAGHSDPYKANKALYAEKVLEIHGSNELSQFSEFCKVKTEELRRARRLSIIHAAGIDTAVYDKLCDNKLPEEKRTEIISKLSAEQLKAIERSRRVKVKPVNPLCITSNSSKVKGYGVDFNDDVEDYKSVINKLLPMLLWAAILTYIALDGIKYGGISAVVMIIFRIVMCLTAMFSGIMSGDGFVIKKDKVILRRIDFIELFHEWQKSQTKSTTNE